MSTKSKNTKSISLKGLKPGVVIHTAECCYPLYGERIVGLMTEGKGVTIHTLDCVALDRYSDNPEIWVDVSWSQKTRENSVGRIIVTLLNKTGSLNTLTNIIAEYGGNITNLLVTLRSEDFFKLTIDIEVNDIKHLNDIILGVKSNINIYEVK